MGVVYKETRLFQWQVVLRVLLCCVVDTFLFPLIDEKIKNLYNSFNSYSIQAVIWYNTLCVKLYE
jgi:hypothetical protein